MLSCRRGAAVKSIQQRFSSLRREMYDKVMKERPMSIFATPPMRSCYTAKRTTRPIYGEPWPVLSLSAAVSVMLKTCRMHEFLLPKTA
eukprot:6184885-Pleurochrysis_carterae.AAC.1